MDLVFWTMWFHYNITKSLFCPPSPEKKGLSIIDSAVTCAAISPCPCLTCWTDTHTISDFIIFSWTSCCFWQTFELFSNECIQAGTAIFKPLTLRLPSAVPVTMTTPTLPSCPCSLRPGQVKLQQCWELGVSSASINEQWNSDCSAARYSLNLTSTTRVTGAIPPPDIMLCSPQRARVARTPQPDSLQADNDWINSFPPNISHFCLFTHTHT